MANRTKDAVCHSRYRVSVCLASLVAVTLFACATAPPESREEEEPAPVVGSLPDSFKILTWNAWHGLATGEFWVTLSETPEDNTDRLKWQVRQIAHASPDVVLLQEVNPLPSRAEAYVEALQELGLTYREIHQVDACGIRMSQKRALVSELNNGLVVLAKEELQLKKIKGLKLSGDLGNCKSTSGMQLEELRYGLIGEITLPGTATKFLVTSLHLHSGVEAGTHFVDQLAAHHERGQLERYPWIKWEIDEGRLRRIGELDVLLRELYKLTRQETYAGIVIAGDFNFESDFPEYEEAVMLRLLDTHTLAVRERELYTADPSRNARISVGSTPVLPDEIQKEIAEEPEDVQDEIAAAYRAEVNRPRRIDYIFVDSDFPQSCIRQELFGLETNEKGLPASDHFGILNTYTLGGGPCQNEPRAANARP